MQTSHKTALSVPDWSHQAQRHCAELEPHVRALINRKARGLTHPIHDFLFTYYRYPPSKLLQWHPSFEEPLECDPHCELPAHFAGKAYQRKGNQLFQNPQILRPKDRERLRFSHNLLRLTAARPPHWSCYGLHEWAMVYRCEAPRHAERAPLRLSPPEIADFLESQTLACSHFDATRFFTPAALPLNRLQPTLLTRQDHEQPACIHANMDLYKWAFKAMPWVGSNLLRQTFLLALKLRELDMRASPYDLQHYGYDAIPIETPAGRAHYIREQQSLSNIAATLRVKLLAKLTPLLTS